MADKTKSQTYNFLLENKSIEDILKQELDNRKNMKPDKLISNEIKNQNSNNVLENSSIESENNQNFDSSIRNTVNQQNPPTPISKNNWDKVKCLLTT